MREKTMQDPPRITFGDTSVAMSRSGRSRPVLAEILGQETNPETGLTTVWLDRLIHRPIEKVLHEGERRWVTAGAISTVLTEQSM